MIKKAQKQEAKSELLGLIEKFKDQEASDITLEEMLKMGVHFGHQKTRWNPRMGGYIFTLKEGVHIIDLEKTRERLGSAVSFLEERIKRGEEILFVGTKRQAKDLVKEAAEHCKMPYVVERWLGGTLTNFEVLKTRINKLLTIEDLEQKGELKKYTKKEQAKFREKIESFNEKMGGIKNMKQLPGVVFVVDSVFDSLAVKEAKRVGIPVVALVDTNADPCDVDYPIPANDDAVKSLRFLLALIAAKVAEVKPGREPEGK
ncbi:MAG: 30S ribosomal protein S2 [Patescibacteria group bacterium]|nr:30S ribosomal protein S2 [Patescibacteria group bacterium]